MFDKYMYQYFVNIFYIWRPIIFLLVFGSETYRVVLLPYSCGSVIVEFLVTSTLQLVITLQDATHVI